MLEARDVLVEAENASVEEETVNCSGEGASKVSLLGSEQSIPFEPSQQNHKPLVALKTISWYGRSPEQID